MNRRDVIGWLAFTAMLCAVVCSHLASDAHDTERRSSKWPAVRAEWLKSHGECAVCGERDKLEVHHVVPFHVDPSRELDESNLITLCTGSTNCHLMFGHLKNFRSWNPDVKKDATIWREKIRKRPSVEAKK